MEKLDEHTMTVLCRRSGLRLNNKEMIKIQKELKELSLYLDKLEEIETAEQDRVLQESCWMHKNKTSLRRDLVEDFEEKDLLLENMPKRNENYVSAPKVIK